MHVYEIFGQVVLTYTIAFRTNCSWLLKFATYINWSWHN